MKQQYSVHHIVPRSQRANETESFNIEENKIVLKDKKHMHIHALFDNDTPVMQLIDVLLLNRKMLNDKFVKDIIAVLEKHVWDYYIVPNYIKDELGKLFLLERHH